MIGKIYVEPIDINQVINLDKERFNSNNHWKNNERPIDYLEKIDANQTHKWIGLFKSNYISFKINNPYHISWMKKANAISGQTGQFSELFADELEEYCQYFYANSNGILPADNTIPYFVRCENVSLKYGTHGPGPYFNIKQIVESLVSSIHGHTPIYPDTNEITLYLIPWESSISDSNEFRVFVKSNKITAISQQALYSRFVSESILSGLNLDKLMEIYAKEIINYFEMDISKKITWMDSYTFDIAVILDDSNKLVPVFIEPNSFGAEYAAGSALFHWICDRDKLYGANLPNVYIRYTY
jgi:hypothetical protein